MKNRVLLAGLFAAFFAFSNPSSAGYVQLNISDRRDYAFDDQDVLYISTASGSVLRYDTQSSAYLDPFKVGGTLLGIDLSPDGTTLAVADTTTQGGNNRIHLINTKTGGATPVSFARDFQETGTYMVAWGSDDQILITSNFAGSGWVPLRRYDPSTNSSVTIGSVRQGSMLTPSADRNTIAIAEANISNGPITAYDVEAHAFDGSVSTNWFTFEVAIDRGGDKYIVPTYFGAFVYDKIGKAFQQQGVIGQYASHGPLAAVFSPVNNKFFTAEWSRGGLEHGVRVYDATTLKLIQTIDPYQFDWNGNGAMGSGRMEISPDGRYLAVSIDDAVRVYDVSAFVPEPATMVSALIGGLAILIPIVKRRFQGSAKLAIGEY